MRIIIRLSAGALLLAPALVVALTFTQSTKINSNLNVYGALNKSNSSFVIDDPLDPTNKLLFHTSVESPDSKNIYDGATILDDKGEAVIHLPPYFDALNESVRYQFFPMGEPMPDLHVKEEEHDNIFTISGGKARGQVSWQITGIRHDPYIKKYPVVVEVEKGPDTSVKKGECIFEPLCK